MSAQSATCSSPLASTVDYLRLIGSPDVELRRLSANIAFPLQVVRHATLVFADGGPASATVVRDHMLLRCNDMLLVAAHSALSVRAGTGSGTAVTLLSLPACTIAHSRVLAPDGALLSAIQRVNDALAHPGVMPATLERVSRAVAEVTGVEDRLPHRRATPRAIDERVAAVREYINGHFQERMHLESIARVAGCSIFHLIREFRRAVGMPPHAYVIDRRIDYARQLIRAGMRPSRVAFEAGFADQPHFNRHFRRLTGMTPGAFARS